MRCICYIQRFKVFVSTSKSIMMLYNIV